MKTNLVFNFKKMFINFLLAIVLIVFAVSALITLDKALNLIEKSIKKTLRFTQRSKLLTEYLLRAYLRYKKIANRQYA